MENLQTDIRTQYQSGLHLLLILSIAKTSPTSPSCDVQLIRGFVGYLCLIGIASKFKSCKGNENTHPALRVQKYSVTVFDALMVKLAPRFSPGYRTRTRKHWISAKQQDTVSHHKHTGHLAEKVRSMLLFKRGAIWDSVFRTVAEKFQ